MHEQIKMTAEQLEDTFAQAMLREVLEPPKLWSINTFTEMSVSYSMASQSEEAKDRKIHATCDMVNKGRNIRQNDIAQDK